AGTGSIAVCIRGKVGGDAPAVSSESVFRKWRGAGASRPHDYGRTVIETVPAIHKCATRRPRFVRQHLSFAADYRQKAIRGSRLAAKRDFRMRKDVRRRTHHALERLVQYIVLRPSFRLHFWG